MNFCVHALYCFFVCSVSRRHWRNTPWDEARYECLLFKLYIYEIYAILFI
ncbi:unnamed protein product, partial [Ixodes persulcatus]